MDQRVNRITRNALVFLPAKIVEGLLVMVTNTVIFTSLFTQAAYGEYQLINTSVLFIYLVLGGWLANATVRYIGEKEDRAFFSTVIVIYTLICIAVLVVSSALFMVSGMGIFASCGIMFVSYALFQLLNGLLIQSGHVTASVVLSILSASLRLICAFTLLNLLLGASSHSFTAVSAAVFADLCAGVAAFFVLGIHRSFSIKAFSRDCLSSFLSFGVPLLGFSISVGLLNMSDRYIVSFISGKESFAVYIANNTIASGIFAMITVGIMRGVYPAVLNAWRNADTTTHGDTKKACIEAALPLLNKGVRLYLLIALPAAAGLAAIGSTLSDLVFFANPSYVFGPVIGLSALAMFMSGLTEYVNKTWELTQDTLPIFKNSIIASVIKIACTVALLPLLGLIGAAIGSLLSYTVYFCVSAFFARRRFVFHIPLMSVLRIIGSSVLCALAAFFMCTVVKAYVGNLLGIGIGVIVAVCVYALTLAISGEIREEIAYVKHMVLKH